ARCNRAPGERRDPSRACRPGARLANGRCMDPGFRREGGVDKPHAMLNTDTRTVYDADLNLFRDQVRKFYDKALIPNLDRWEDDGLVDRDFWRAAGEAGILCPQVPEAYGGL